MGKCKYSKDCNIYSETSETCNETDGKYFKDNYSICYILMERKNV